MRPTKEGIRFILATFLIALAAFNTGNNLIYMLLSMMLSIMILSYVLLKVNVHALSLRLRAAGQVFAGESSTVEFELTNHKRIFSSYSIRVLFPAGVEGICVIDGVTARSSSVMRGSVMFGKRGVFDGRDIKIESGFPFVFFRTRVNLDATGSVLVYPRILPVIDVEKLSVKGQGDYTRRPGGREELLGIRDFRLGDDLKLVSWKASAKAEKLLVREFAEDAPGAMTIVLDNLSPESPEPFERAVSICASYAGLFIREGKQVRLIACNESVPFGMGADHYYRMLDLLAVIGESDSAECRAYDNIEGHALFVLKSKSSRLMNRIDEAVVYADSL